MAAAASSAGNRCAAYTTFAAAAPEAGAIDPAGFSIPIKDPLTAARFVARPPARSVEWMERAADRPGVIRLNPDLAPPAPPDLPPRGIENRSIETRGPRPPPAPSVPVPAVPPPSAAQASAAPGPPPAPIDESYYIAPVYTGIIIMNPPERDPDKDKDPHRKDGRRQRVARPADGPVARGDDLSRGAR